MVNQSKYSATYLRFLNLVQAIREIPTFPAMDPVEERLLTLLASVWHLEKKISVLEAMSLTNEISATTAHRRLKTLRKKGMIDLDTDQVDSRVKYVVPTALAKQYFTTLGQALDRDDAQTGAAPKTQTNVLTLAASAIAVALLWVLLFRLNRWALSSFDVTVFISWIFLPAAIRMLAIMACDWVGAVGLFAGALFTNQADPTISLTDGIVLAFLSSAGPLVAFWCCTRLLRLPFTLTGLTAKQLLVFATVGAALNAVPHNIYFFLSGRMTIPIDGLVPMFLGDLVGTMVVLYAVSLALRLLFKRSAGQQRVSR